LLHLDDIMVVYTCIGAHLLDVLVHLYKCFGAPFITNHFDF